MDEERKCHSLDRAGKEHNSMEMIQFEDSPSWFMNTLVLDTLDEAKGSGENALVLAIIKVARRSFMMMILKFYEIYVKL